MSHMYLLFNSLQLSPTLTACWSFAIDPEVHKREERALENLGIYCSPLRDCKVCSTVQTASRTHGGVCTVQSLEGKLTLIRQSRERSSRRFLARSVSSLLLRVSHVLVITTLAAGIGPSSRTLPPAGHIISYHSLLVIFTRTD